MEIDTNTSAIKSIKRESTSEQVFQQLKKLIDMSVWKPGYRIPSENELAKQFGVSRMTIRAATQKLKTLGLLDVCPGSGSFVKAPTLEAYIFGSDSADVMPNALSDAFSLRFYLEQAAVEFAIKNATDEDIETLHGILEKLKDAADNHPADFREYDMDFHRFIYVMSSNQLLLTIFKMMEPLLKAQIDRFDSHVRNSEELRMGRQNFHSKLYNGIASRDLEYSLKQLAWYQEASKACSI
jgi:GntR family transcriptional repressor for pyruvate dehydrogenase complex